MISLFYNQILSAPERINDKYFMDLIEEKSRGAQNYRISPGEMFLSKQSSFKYTLIWPSTW